MNDLNDFAKKYEEIGAMKKGGAWGGVSGSAVTYASAPMTATVYNASTLTRT